MHRKIVEKNFEMAIFGHSEFLPNNFSLKTGINLEWPKMAILNFSHDFSQKDWYKFGMAEIGRSKFFPTIFPKKTGTNL